MKKIYNKLVRDNIPSIIEASGAECKYRILENEEYLELLDKKLDEELLEYHADQSIEELADLIEVIYAAALARGYTLDELEAIRKNKALTRGAFKNRIMLIETEKHGG